MAKVGENKFNYKTLTMAKAKKEVREFKKFSKQETKVFEMLITEHKGEEIAKIMGLNEKTISTYKLRLLKKTKSKTIIGLYLFNQKHQIIPTV